MTTRRDRETWYGIHRYTDAAASQAEPSRASRAHPTSKKQIAERQVPRHSGHHTTRRGSGTDVTHGLLVLELSSSPAGRVRWRVPLASGVDMVQCTRVRMRSDGDGDGTGLLQEREMESE
jgi:hypothetical protein